MQSVYVFNPGKDCSFPGICDPLVRPTGFLMNHKKKASQEGQGRVLLVLDIVKPHKHIKTLV